MRPATFPLGCKGFTHLLRNRETRYKRWTFSVLGFGLAAMVGVILALAFQRLQLYEAAYGFTRLRISTQGFLVWLALLPALIVLLEILRRERAFALAALLAAAGFAASLMLMTVVAVIVHQNFTFSIWGADLDMT